MPTDKEKRRKRLQDEGVLVGEPPDPYLAVIDGLTPEEVEVIVAVKKRLVEADRVAGTKPGPKGEPGFVMFMHF